MGLLIIVGVGLVLIMIVYVGLVIVINEDRESCDCFKELNEQCEIDKNCTRRDVQNCLIECKDL